jgi:hypothetical protein
MAQHALMGLVGLVFRYSIACAFPSKMVMLLPFVPCQKCRTAILVVFEMLLLAHRFQFHDAHDEAIAVIFKYNAHLYNTREFHHIYLL